MSDNSSPNIFASQSPPDVQQAVISPHLWPITMENGHPTAIIRFYFMDEDKDERKKAGLSEDDYKRLKKAVRTTIKKSAKEAKKQYYLDRNKPEHASWFIFDTWEDHANVEFQEVGSLDNSDIRISFLVGVSSSLIGTTAIRKSKSTSATVKLGVLREEEQKYPPTKENRRHILHEFGHVLGLRHGHQSPTLAGRLSLKEDVIKAEFSELDDKALKKYLKQIATKLDANNLWNYTNFDTKSIMNYCIPEHWQQQSRKIQINQELELSKVDKAVIRLLYPPDIRNVKNRAAFMNALHVLRVNSDTAGKMIGDVIDHDEKRSIADRLTVMRNRFDIHIQGSVILYDSNRNFYSGIDPASLRQYGISDFAGEVTKNKLFQSITKNIIYRRMVQNGIPMKMSIPGAAPSEAAKVLSALSMHVVLGQLVQGHKSAFIGEVKERKSVFTGEDDNKGRNEKTPNDAQDNTPKHPPPSQERPMQIDVWTWMRACKGSATAHITKPKGGKSVTIKFPSLLMNPVVLLSDERSTSFINQRVDAGAQLHFNDIEEIGTATKARWTLQWVVLYRDQWDIKNFAACIIPQSPGLGPTTGFVSDDEELTRVQS